MLGHNGSKMLAYGLLEQWWLRTVVSMIREDVDESQLTEEGPSASDVVRSPRVKLRPMLAATSRLDSSRGSREHAILE